MCGLARGRYKPVPQRGVNGTSLSHAELHFHVKLWPAGGAEAAQPGSDAAAQQRDEDSAAAVPDLPGAHTSAADGGAGRGGGCGLGGNADVAVARAGLLYHCGSHQVPAGCRLLNNEAPNTTPQVGRPRGGARKRSRDTVSCGGFCDILSARLRPAA